MFHTFLIHRENLLYICCIGSPFRVDVQTAKADQNFVWALKAKYNLLSHYANKISLICGY